MGYKAYSNTMQTTKTSRWAAAVGVVIVATLPAPVLAQSGTDIFLVNISRDGGVRLGTPINVTDRPGYDNQPSFTPDGKVVLYTSIRGDQADIWMHDLETGSNSAVTTTRESEYSATVMPGGRTFSVVRVETDSAQRLWQFHLDGTNPKVIYERIMPVGYHAWIDATTTAMFILGQPPTLQIGDVETGAAQTVASNIGRSIHKAADKNAVIFLHHVSQDEDWIAEWDLETGQVRHLVEPVGDGQDFEVMYNGTIVMGDGSRLFAWREEWAGWEEVADFTGQITGITRLAGSPNGDRIAIVGSDIMP
jgi:WD40 repeat protein